MIVDKKGKEIRDGMKVRMTHPVTKDVWGFDIPEITGVFDVVIYENELCVHIKVWDADGENISATSDLYYRLEQEDNANLCEVVDENIPNDNELIEI